MDAVTQLEAELKVLDGPAVEVATDAVDDHVVAAEEEPPVPDEEREAKKLRAAQTLAVALDRLGEHIAAARGAAHGLVEAFLPVESAGHPLTIESPVQEPTEPQDDEVPQKS